jgi:N-acetylmuramoyl-L-alanine amidase
MRSCAVALASQNWDLIKRDGRDFVTLESITRFYGLQMDSIRTTAFRGPLGATQFQMLSEDGREIEMNGARYWLCFPIVQEGETTLISRMDLVKTIEPVLRPRAIRNLEPFTTVVIDPGHGGHDKGASSRFSHEKVYTLDVAKRLAPLLRVSGLRTVLTRTKDEFIPLMTRAAIANRTPSSIFVSIHFNSSGNRAAAEGVEVFAITPRGAPSSYDKVLSLSDLEAQAGNAYDAQSMALATAVHKSLLKRGGQVDRGVKRARFTVLAATRHPSVLIEGGFLSNKKEASYIASSAWRQRLAQAIAAGILAYKRIADSSAASPIANAAPSMRFVPDDQSSSTAPLRTNETLAPREPEEHKQDP